MNDIISIPPAASLFILLQRTAYQSKLLSRLLRRVPGRLALFYAQIEATLRRDQIAFRFAQGIRRDFKSIEAFLPKSARAILDVGCGLAAIDVLLSRHYSPQGSVHLYLADYDEISSRIAYGFGPNPSRYSSFAVAKELLLLNKVPENTVHFISPEDIGDPHRLPRLQLVVSMLAWGFHFPVDTYAQAVSQALDEDGKVILDVRAGTDGMRRLKEYFPVVQVIEESEVRTRVMACK